MKGTLTLSWSSGAFSIGHGTGPRDVVLARGYPAADAPAATARAAVGVQHDDGMLAWVELDPGTRSDASTAAAMDDLLDRMGCSARMTLPGDAQALLGGAVDAGGAPVLPIPAITARLVRGRAPDAHPIFAETPVVSAQVWQPLQAKRVRYFFKPDAINAVPSTPPSVHTSAP
jgi:hypothetical protein